MKALKTTTLVIAVAMLAGGLYWWWQVGKTYPSTDDAYLEAHILTVAPEVAGRVSEVGAAENARVIAGDILVKLDDSALRAALVTAQARYDAALQDAGATGSDLAAAAARAAAARSSLAEAISEYQRAESLFKLGDVAQAVLDEAQAARDQAQASFGVAEAAVAAARDQLGKSGSENAGVRAALGALDQARINLEHATIRAPASGWIANNGLRPGQFIVPGQALFSLVEDATWWVDGNFKETDIARIRPGQPVSLSVDMYPGETLTGKVDSIGAGSGAVFSLLPPENATGNWVKVT